MPGAKTLRHTAPPLAAKRRKDGPLLIAFNTGLVTFFTAIYFLSLLGFAL
jgi:hypothetical protein